MVGISENPAREINNKIKKVKSKACERRRGNTMYYRKLPLFKLSHDACMHDDTFISNEKGDGAEIVHL